MKYCCSRPDAACTLLFTLLPSPRCRLHAVAVSNAAWLQCLASFYLSIIDTLAGEMCNSMCTANWKADWQDHPEEEPENTLHHNLVLHSVICGFFFHVFRKSKTWR